MVVDIFRGFNPTWGNGKQGLAVQCAKLAYRHWTNALKKCGGL